MKILFLTNNPNLEGTTRILQSWLLLGRSEGIQGMVVARGPGGFTRWLAANGFPHRVDPIPWPDTRWPFPSLWHAGRLAYWAHRLGCDLIHCNEHDVYPFGLLIRRLLRRPLICHVRYQVHREFCSWIFGGKGRTPDALLWNSQQLWDDCKEAVEGVVPRERQHLVRLGIETATFGNNAASRDQTRQEWGVRSDQVVVGTASALRPVKRIEDFVDLIARLAARNPQVVGMIAGDMIKGEEDYGRSILRRIDATGLGERLRWLGHLDSIEPFHHALDVYVSTSEYESFGNSVCEAMVCRRPVAAYRGGAVHEVVGPAGPVVGNADLPALCAVVENLIQSPELRQVLGERGRRRVIEHFRPASSLHILRQIYATLAP